ncbi:Proline racemase [Rhodopirellula sallentina SM41]|uniref:Proline racemase n=1 Tax=Rhodopirellula sallentina SM41 TaxID=1263870 RepID=M5TVC6_9BACT|nr:Proline racemase [Rhodopirellula sallentina SM41]
METSVGIVEFDLRKPNEVAIGNVPSYRLEKDVQVEVDGFGTVVGDIAWGGNWFFLVGSAPAEIRLEKPGNPQRCFGENPARSVEPRNHGQRRSGD